MKLNHLKDFRSKISVWGVPRHEWKARGINWIARFSDCDAIANFSRKMLSEKD